jgi:hypothetical protein
MPISSRFYRIKALGPILLDRPYDPVNNPLLWNLIAPGHPSNGSSLSLGQLKQLGVIR